MILSLSTQITSGHLYWPFCKQSLTPTTKSAILKMHKKDYFYHEIHDYQVSLNMANFTSDKIKVDEQYKPIFSFLYDWKYGRLT